MVNLYQGHTEYCVRGSKDELPLKNLQIIPFNSDHAERTGVFASAIFIENKVNVLNLSPRAIIPNDSKLFAQADMDKTVVYFITSDSKSLSTFNALSKHHKPGFPIVDIASPYNEIFGILEL